MSRISRGYRLCTSKQAENEASKQTLMIEDTPLRLEGVSFLNIFF
uniref:Uncharacterized protein n=1 Tax=Paenibacillus brasilensis TaxID=128574 RepID=A0A3Q8GWY5_9BACL|nr:hypothetical protein PB24_4061 [Paenibacillus brasilensis]